MNISKFVLILASLSLVLASYNPADGVEYGFASALASCQAAQVLNWTCGFPCQNLTGYQPFASELFTLSEQETLAYSMIFNPTTQRFITTFRGTAGSYELNLEYNLSNALTYSLSNVAGALIDDYFYTRYVDVFRPNVVANLQKAYASYPEFSFIFTGHSLGAALTTIAALDIATNGPVPNHQITIYNYGSPRVGNQAFADAVESVVSEIYRVTHWRDIVPHLPPCLQNADGQCTPISITDSTASLMWPVWHVAQEIFYNEANTNYTECVGNEDPNCADQFPLTDTTWDDHNDYLNINMSC